MRVSSSMETSQHDLNSHSGRDMGTVGKHNLPIWASLSSGGGGGAPLYGLNRYVRPQRSGFSAILVIKRVWFLHSSLEVGVFFKRSFFFRS